MVMSFKLSCLMKQLPAYALKSFINMVYAHFKPAKRTANGDPAKFLFLPWNTPEILGKIKYVTDSRCC